MVLTPDAAQALVNEWDEQQRKQREQEQLQASLYRNRSRMHGSGLTEDEQEEKDFRRRFPHFKQVCVQTKHLQPERWRHVTPKNPQWFSIKLTPT